MIVKTNCSKQRVPQSNFTLHTEKISEKAAIVHLSLYSLQTSPLVLKSAVTDSNFDNY